VKDVTRGFGAQQRTKILNMFAPGVIEKIEGRLGIRSPYDVFRRELALRTFQCAESLSRGYPARPAWVGKRLAAIREACDSLLKEIVIQDDGDPVGDQVAFLLCTDGISFKELLEVNSSLVDLRDAAIKAGRSIADRGGRPPHQAKSRLAYHLKDLTARVSGTSRSATKADHKGTGKRFSGIVFDLFSAADRVIETATGTAALRNDAVGKLLERTPTKPLRK